MSTFGKVSFSQKRNGIKNLGKLAKSDAATKPTQKNDHAMPAPPDPEEISRMIPSWFLEHRVKTAEELSRANIALVVRESSAIGDDVSPGDDVLDADTYEIESVVYEPLLNVLKSRSTESKYVCGFGSNDKRSFWNNAVYLRFPDKKKAPDINPLYTAGHLRSPEKIKARGSNLFYTAVVERFAQNAGADLITLGPDDLDDLSEHLKGLKPKSEANRNPNNPNKGYFRPHEDPFASGYGRDRYGARLEHWSKRRDAQESAVVESAFLAILRSPKVKRTRNGVQTAVPSTNPLVVHLGEADRLLDLHGEKFLRKLRDAIVASNADAIVLSTADQASRGQSSLTSRTRDHRIHFPPIDEYGIDDMGLDNPLDDPDIDLMDYGDTHPPEFPSFEPPGYRAPGSAGHMRPSEPMISAILHATGTNPRLEAICMAPLQSKAQRALLEAHQKLEESCEKVNVRSLQRSTRRVSAKHAGLPILQPYAKWLFLETTISQNIFAKAALNEDELIGVVQDVGDSVDEEHIKDAILRMGRRREALDVWREGEKKEVPVSRWSAFPENIQNVIKEVEMNRRKFGWERRFLDLLIVPNEVEEGWSDIALDSEVKETLVQLLHQPSNTGTSGYGTLKHGRVGGALLYGPPGAGKTHLARVLARESKAITICVSAADIEYEFVGETEKAIKGLFSLGQMLSPCTIFIDEADALFRSRKHNDTGYERSKTNQLLYEMDGLKKSKTPPFVILATNFPRDLDHAVLRRVPSRVHIGLPSTENRREIFVISLRDEVLDADVNLNHLAEISEGFSGSDIQTVCVQAALICDAVVGDEDSRRLLKQEHFDKAFRRTAATTSKMCLAEIKAFAKEFDPAALEKMGQGADLYDEGMSTRSFRATVPVSIRRVRVDRRL